MEVVSLDIGNVADETLLAHVWRKEVRPELRSMTFNNFNFAVDPLHYAAYEWGLTTLVSALARELRMGRYSPERGEIVRSAKGIGLSRPLCFLATRDALVYRCITYLVRNQLVADAEKWVGFEHADKGNKDTPLIDEAGDSFDWFRFWLARQGSLLEMIDDDSITHFVESDIANFYPSISLEAVREHLHSQTKLVKEVVRLCVQIIDGVMPRSDYSEVSLMGLPQDHIGSSRAIAHSLLLHVDKEFRTEGEAGRYTRYMDDFLVAVTSVSAGQGIIGRLQLSLETLGLYPNAAKTHVLSKEQYLKEYMVEQNGELERLSAALESLTTKTVPHETTPTEEQRVELSEMAVAHRTLEIRPKRWNRVSRRIYSLMRDIDNTDWQKYWLTDIQDDPGSAAPILEYVRSWPLDAASVGSLLDLSQDLSSLYADTPLLIAEVIVSAPVADDPKLWSTIFSGSLGEFRRLANLGRTRPQYERLAAAWLLSAWKFANKAQRQVLLDAIPDDLDAISPIRAQALPLLAAEGRSISEWVAAKPGLDWATALSAEYLRSLEVGEDRATGVALDLSKPQLRLKPQRFTVLPRALPLVEILGKAASAKLLKVAPKALANLRKNPDRLRDHRLEYLIAPWCP